MFPTLTVEAAFGVNPLTTPTATQWSDITQYVRGVSYHRGRQHELSRTEAGGLEVRLANLDRAFDPTNTASPYYPNIKPMTRIRLRARYPGGNLLTANQASLETDTTGWAAFTNCSIARSTAQALDGGASLALTATALGSMEALTPLGTSGIPVTPGVLYTFLMSFRPGTTARGVRINIRWYTSSGASAGTTLPASINEVAGAWTEFAYTVQAPATAAFVSMSATVFSAAAGEVHYVDAVSIHQGTSRTFAISSLYELAQGFVEDWGQQWPGRTINGAGDAEVTVRCADGFKLLALHQLQTYRAAIAEDAPTGHWPLDETSGTTATESAFSGSQFPGTYTGAYTLNSAGPLGGGRGALTLAGGHVTTTNPTALRFTGDLTLEALIYPTGAGARMIIDGGDCYQLYLNASNVLRFLYVSKSGYTKDLAGPTITASTWTHVAVVKRKSERVVSFYVDGVLAATAATDQSGTAQTTTWALSFGKARGAISAWSGRLAHVAIYGVQLDASRIAAHAAIPIDRYAAVATGTQIGYTLDAIGWPAASRDLDTGSSTLAASDPSGSALDWLLLAAEDSEGGILFVQGDGSIRFVERHALLGPPFTDSQGTFGDDISELEYADLTVSFDEANLWTSVTVTRENGSPQRAEDTAARDSYGPRALERNAQLLATDTECNDAANYLLTRYKEPQIRPETVTFEATSDDPLWEQLLTREIGDRVTVNRRPPGGGSMLSKEALIEAISVSVTLHESWTTTWTLAPADPNAYWLLGTSELGVDTRLGW